MNLEECYEAIDSDYDDVMRSCLLYTSDAADEH